MTVAGRMTAHEVEIRLAGRPHAVRDAARQLAADPGLWSVRLASALGIGLFLAARHVTPKSQAAVGIKEMAAATYLFVDQHSRLGAAPVAALRRAEAALRQALPAWDAYKPRVQRILLTMFLLQHANPDEWAKRKLQNPTNVATVKPESFYRRFIQPRLGPAREDIRGNPFFSEGIDPRIRFVLAPWEDRHAGRAAITAFRRALKPPSRPRRRRKRQ